MELILNLGNATGGLKTEKLVRPTVDSMREVAENGDRPSSWMGWRAAFSMIGRKLAVKQFAKRNKGALMKPSVTNILIALGLIIIGIAIAGAGIYIGETDDAPGAALLGILLMIGTVVLSVRTALRKA